MADLMAVVNADLIGPR